MLLFKSLQSDTEEASLVILTSQATDECKLLMVSKGSPTAKDMP